MGIVGFDVNKMLPQSNATILVSRGVVEQPCAHRPLVVPHSPSSSRVQGKYVIGRSYVHHSINDYRCYLETLRVAGMEGPCRAQLCNVCDIDFTQVAVAAPAVVAVIRGPVGPNRPC